VEFWRFDDFLRRTAKTKKDQKKSPFSMMVSGGVNLWSLLDFSDLLPTCDDKGVFADDEVTYRKRK
jgi:hypothetical protein